MTVITLGSQMKLPSGPLVIGYEVDCNQRTIEAVENGVNVIIWFNINMIERPEGIPQVQTGLNLPCIAQVDKTLRDRNIEVTHLISIGGWNSPHPITKFSAHIWWQTWLDWNQNTVAKPELGFNGFDGFDWDLEGNDDVNSPWNYFTVEVLNLMGELSQLAKKDGYIVSMAPAQSYLDVENHLFDRSVSHIPTWIPNFPYQGYNTYAPILAKYGLTQITSNEKTELIPTFDFISIQLYEGWSRANHLINDHGILVAQYLIDLVEKMSVGWEVDFSSDPDMGIETQRIQINPSQLVIGLANGWTGPRPSKFLLIYPEELKEAYKILLSQGNEFRGFMFWNIQGEGIPVNGVPIYLSKIQLRTPDLSVILDQSSDYDKR